MRRAGAYPLPPPVIQRRFAFTKNPYRQLTCVSTVRLVLGILAIIFAILEGILRSRYHDTWHLAASGSFYVLASLLAFLGCAYASVTQHRLLWIHSWLSILACLFIYPAEVGLMSLELCHDTAWCLCVVHPRKPCPQNWAVVPIELAALFVTTIAFVLNLLAAVVSRKTWKAASARLERIRSSSCRRTLKRAKLEADECLATNFQQQQFQRKPEQPYEPAIKITVHNYDDQARLRSEAERDFRFLFIGAAAATAASAAAAPMFGASRTVVDHLNRPRTLLYPQKEITDEEEPSEDNNCALYWWRSPENFV